MPQARKLSADEVQSLQNKGKSPRKLLEEEYTAILSDYAVGDYGEATLAPGENRLTIRNRCNGWFGLSVVRRASPDYVAPPPSTTRRTTLPRTGLC